MHSLIFVFCLALVLATHHVALDLYAEESDYEYIYYEDGYTEESLKETITDENGSTGSTVEVLEAGHQERDVINENPERHQPPVPQKRGFQAKYNIPGLNLDQKLKELKPLMGGQSLKLLNETMVLYDCWPMGDMKGSRAYDTEEMQRIGEVSKTKITPKDNVNRKKSLQEIQEEKMRKRLEEVTKSKKMNRVFTMGADCETLVCGSCKVLVEEFAVAITEAVNDPSKEYLDQVFEGFCQSRPLNLKYHDVVANLCANQITTGPDYKEAFLTTFEMDTNYEKIASVESILDKKKKICGGVGACSEKQLTFSNIPIYRYQEQWNDSCFVCQAVADDIEEKIVLHRKVTDSIAASIVDGSCGRLGLPPTGDFNDLCLQFTKGSKGDDMAWITKVYADKVVAKPQTEKRFSDSLCEEMKLCKKWLNEDALSKEKTMKEIEAVFE